MNANIPKEALICGARHFISAHESECTQRPVDFGAVCVNCPVWEACKGQWMKTAAPLFDAAGIHPNVCEATDEEKYTSASNKVVLDDAEALKAVIYKELGDSTQKAQDSGAGDWKDEILNEFTAQISDFLSSVHIP